MTGLAIMITIGVGVFAMLYFSTAYLVARNVVSVARRAILAGRDDIARDVLSGAAKGPFGRPVIWLLPKDLKRWAMAGSKA